MPAVEAGRTVVTCQNCDGKGYVSALDRIKLLYYAQLCGGCKGFGQQVVAA